MKKTNVLKLAVLSIVTMIATILVTSKSQAADAPGLALFKKYSCNECHAISALGVKVEESKDSKEAKDADAGDPPDLSGEGLEKDHDQAWLRKFMRKTETLNGKKHQKLFKGEKEELTTLTEWLTTLKTKVAQPKKK
jgi:cytochrome c peroxidase